MHVHHVCLVPEEARIPLYSLQVAFQTVVSCHVAHMHTYMIISHIFKIKLKCNL